MVKSRVKHCLWPNVRFAASAVDAHNFPFASFLTHASSRTWRNIYWASARIFHQILSPFPIHLRHTHTHMHFFAAFYDDLFLSRTFMYHYKLHTVVVYFHIVCALFRSSFSFVPFWFLHLMNVDLVFLFAIPFGCPSIVSSRFGFSGTFFVIFFPDSLTCFDNDSFSCVFFSAAVNTNYKPFILFCVG